MAWVADGLDRSGVEGRVRVLGVDLAWSEGIAANETGVVAVEEDGMIADAGWIRGVPETVAWANDHASRTTVMFVDAPLVVPNPTGQRRCETQVGQSYGRWKVSANLNQPRQSTACWDAAPSAT